MFLRKIFISLSILLITAVVIISTQSTEKIGYFGSSAMYLINRHVLQKEYLVAKSNYGVNFKFKPADAVGRKIYKTKDYEPDITRFILSEIKLEQGDIIIDVGANIGWYSLILAKNSTHNIGNIYAFEPDEINYKLLTDNISLNKITNVIAVNKAVSNITGTATLYKYGDKNLGRHSMLPLFDGKQETITTLTLDNFINDNNLKGRNIKLLKIDVEGFEGNVLLGAVKTLPNVKYILQEFSPNLMKNGDVTPEKLLNLLLGYGFKPYQIINGKAQPLELDTLTSLQDGTNIFWKKL